jgi:hypothetical protein
LTDKTLDPLTLKAIVESIKKILEVCGRENTLCLDIPATTTSLLECLGYNEYFIRRTWHVIEEADGFRFPIYSHSGVSFNILLEHRKEPVPRYRDTCIPMSIEACKQHPSECTVTPHTHALYIYIEGHIGKGGYVKVNLVRILRLLYMEDKDITMKIISLVENLLSGKGDINTLYKSILTLLARNRHVLKYILPYIPSTIEALLASSPLSRLLSVLMRRG